MAKKKSTGRTVADFRAAHDKNVIVPSKIRKALEAMIKENGAEDWCYETELLKRAGVSTTELAQFREQFEDHIVEAGGRTSKRVWFATAAVAKKLRSK